MNFSLIYANDDFRTSNDFLHRIKPYHYLLVMKASNSNDIVVPQQLQTVESPSRIYNEANQLFKSVQDSIDEK